MRGKTARVLLALTLAVGAATPGLAAARAAKPHAPPPGKVYTWGFQADTLGQKPAYSMSFGGGNWQVVEDSAATGVSDAIARAGGAIGDTTAVTPLAVALPAAPRFLHQSETGDGAPYHYLSFTRPMLADQDASVRFRIRSGEIDPSAGLLFQMDPKGTSGYMVRASARTGEVSFHYLLYGKRRDVKFAKITPPELGSWHTLGITRRRTLLTVLYDGQEVMAVRDDRFRQGTVGVLTEDDSMVDFADLTATAR
ncbi:MAG TPA: hypothetical protein VN539_02050 [Candidatus Saccharimonadales bacterium]|nr:hypothetical protein [Candidatus Saccharimonadales bacterium]